MKDMKSNCFLRQILIAILIIALFSIGLFGVLFFALESPITVLSVHDFDSTTAVVIRSESNKTGADCPLYSLGNHTYLALFDTSCTLSSGGFTGDMRITRNGNNCMIAFRGKNETRTAQMAQMDEKRYEFFGGVLSVYPVGEGWICVLSLSNHPENVLYERIRFGSIEMTAKEYRNAYPEDTDGFDWDEEHEVYVDEMGRRIDVRYGAAYEVPVFFSMREKDAFVSFYLTGSDYACLMENKVFELTDANNGRMNALFWEKE